MKDGLFSVNPECWSLSGFIVAAFRTAPGGRLYVNCQHSIVCTWTYVVFHIDREFEFY